MEKEIKKTKTYKWFVATIIFCIVVLVSLAVTLIVYSRPIDMPKKEYNSDDYHTAFYKLYTGYKSTPPKTKEECRDIITKQTGIGLYLYHEKKMGGGYNGAMFVLIRLIVVDERLTGDDYCTVFAHEALHLSKFSDNETYISFETFKYLYENEDDYLHNAGVLYGLSQLRGCYRGLYDCSGYIINYLTQEAV